MNNRIRGLLTKKLSHAAVVASIGRSARAVIMEFVRQHGRAVLGALAVGTLCMGTAVLAAITPESVFKTAASNQVASTTLSIEKPSSVSTGKLMIATIAIHGGSAATISAVPSGWTQIGRTDNDANISLVTYWKVAGASEPSTYDWAVDGQTTAEGGITVYSGVDTSSPIDTYSGNTGLDVTATTSPITTTANSEELVTAFAVDEGKTTVAGSYFATSTGMTKKFDVSNTPFGPSLSVQEAVQVSAGATSSKSSAISGNSNPKNWVTQIIALRPPPPQVVANGGYDGGYNSSGSFSANPNGGTACFVGWGGYRAASTSLSWGGNAMTEAVRTTGFTDVPGNQIWHADIWYIKNPPSGTSTVSYTNSGGYDSNKDAAEFGWLCTTGEASSPIGAVDNSSNNNNVTTHFDLSITTTQPNSLILGTMFNNEIISNMTATGTLASYLCT